MRDAVVNGATLGIAPLLIGGRDARKRLAIHQRHYETSLVNALLGKFPATAWLVGTPFVTEAAGRFIREHPPHAPCIAEYGEGFPECLAEYPASNRAPYLRAFAELEWRIGQVAIAVDHPAVTLEHFSKIDPEVLPALVLTLQVGVHYVDASFAIDELMKLYLTETAPDRFELSDTIVWLEVHGARGEFHINRLDAAAFVFRKAISNRLTIGDAAESVLDTHPAFDPGQSLAALITAGLVTAIES
jgi:hypothetical protein